MKTKISGVYKLTNKINNKIYIGKSIDLSSRFYRYKRNENKNQLISRAIKKYGWNNFEVEILADYGPKPSGEIAITSLDWELKALETSFIDYYNSINRKIGYNVCLFASDRTGTKQSKKTREKISKAGKGIKKTRTMEESIDWSKRHSMNKISKETELKRKISKKGTGLKTYSIINPNGQKVIFIGLENFCKENNLGSGSLCRLFCGKIDMYKGWIRAEPPQISKRSPLRVVKFVYLDDSVIETTKGIVSFCKEKKLDIRSIYKVISGKARIHRGWSLHV